MKKFVYAAALASVFTVPAMAQDQSAPAEEMTAEEQAVFDAAKEAELAEAAAMPADENAADSQGKSNDPTGNEAAKPEA
ncbi:MAG: hypothetical protein RLN87_04480 [Parasphingopyxis sp.]|uniref:hypothetical protein n=1 Tax=Parasphingopyxis sp. TaxID=1920299 RepID=UPI0032EBC84C